MRFIGSLFLALALLAGPAQADIEEVSAAEVVGSTELSAKEAGELLSKSVVQLKRYSQTYCTASRIGEQQYLSAGHCAGSVFGSRVYSPNGYEWVGIRSVTVTTQEKPDGKRDEDWMVINTVDDLEDTVALTLGCEDELYLGMGIAYAGYPAPLDFAMGTGRIISLNKTNGSRNNLDFVIDVAAAPGASGSPVISLDTGHVIGVLTEGVPSRVGFFAVGVEHIAGLDICEDKMAKTEAKDEGGDPVLGNPDELASPF